MKERIQLGTQGRSDALPGRPWPLFPLGMLAFLLFLIPRFIRLVNGPSTEWGTVGSPQEVLLQKRWWGLQRGPVVCSRKGLPSWQMERDRNHSNCSLFCRGSLQSWLEKKNLSKQSKQKEKDSHMFIATLSQAPSPISSHSNFSTVAERISCLFYRQGN